MEKRFPILGDIAHINWWALTPHEAQAIRNHSQTLERLAERGGLAVLEDRPYIKMDEKEAKRKVIQLTNKKCKECGGPLILGRFAHNQTTCWPCFKDQYLKILAQHTGEERDILVYVMAVVAEVFGEEW